jgi:hypothetical protein
MPSSAAVLSNSKWIEGISPDQPVCEVASQVLAVCLKAACQLLPLTTTRCDEDVEHVHRLRISALGTLTDCANAALTSWQAAERSLPKKRLRPP